jgi:hypothetical protein
MGQYERPPDARVLQVVEVVYLRGSGVAPDLVRECRAYYGLDGELLADTDPHKPKAA